MSNTQTFPFPSFTSSQQYIPSWSKIDTVAEEPHHFESSALFGSGVNIQKSGSRGSIFADINRKESLRRVVRRGEERVLREGF